MNTLGVYEVTGPVAFRNHKPGSVFTGSIAPSVERRRVANGHLRLLERIPASLPARWSLPGGWR